MKLNKSLWYDIYRYLLDTDRDAAVLYAMFNNDLMRYKFNIYRKNMCVPDEAFISKYHNRHLAFIFSALRNGMQFPGMLCDLNDTIRLADLYCGKICNEDMLRDVRYSKLYDIIEIKRNGKTLYNKEK